MSGSSVLVKGSICFPGLSGGVKSSLNNKNSPCASFGRSRALYAILGCRLSIKKAIVMGIVTKVVWRNFGLT